jgi:hypothetical protein
MQTQHNHAASVLTANHNVKKKEECIEEMMKFTIEKPAQTCEGFIVTKTLGCFV